MLAFVLRVLACAASLWLASTQVPGMHIEGASTLVLAALLLGVANAVVRPIAVFLTFPITMVTLGLSLLVINAAMLGLVAYLLADFTLDGFVPALLGSIIVGVTGWLASWFIPDGSDD